MYSHEALLCSDLWLSLRVDMKGTCEVSLALKSLLNRDECLHLRMFTC